MVARDQVDRVERLLTKLRNEIARRQQLLAAQGFAGLAEQRAATSRRARGCPGCSLLLDWWEGFFAAFERYDYGRLIETLLQLLREGTRGRAARRGHRPTGPRCSARSAPCSATG